ncbi:Hypothetical protein R9X50_00054800 [Acrodontium crateriforme]|uniref:Uncharacterized protein n=1 Tax=Acrodontium crateriforme TaxID=150365 RepID=A0AAQ3LY26_9PEZI|nr:Hypothetical protein R9X50_00054800 [Acrodontium crateriforme]
MSDALRQSTTDKIGSSMKPDSQKSTLEQTSDSLKSTADSVGKTLQPESQKSTGQKMTDGATSAGDDASKEGKSIIGQAQDALGLGDK